MKKLYLSILFILSISFIMPSQSGVSAANKQSIVQQIEEKRVTIDAKERTLDYILGQITKQTRVGFAYINNKIDKRRVMSLSVSNVTVKEALDRLFMGTDLNYTIKGNLIQIIVRPPVKVSVKRYENYTGKLIDIYKKPLVGGTIIISGTPDGAISDPNGIFSLRASEGDEIEINFMGYQTKRVTLGANHEEDIVITLLQDELSVEDIVITGYQNIKVYENVGAVSKLSMEDVTIDATQSLEQMLEGKIAGMVVNNPSGVVGQRQKTRIRGTSSLLGNQEPVWVVDGIIQEDPLPFNTQDFNAIADGSGDGADMIKDFVGNAISWLNPNDIENITVLKDAASTVLYGTKAANGVIVITTKQGKLNSRTTIGYSGGVTIKSPVDYEDLYIMDSKDRVDVDREMIEKGYSVATSSAQFGFRYLYEQYLNKIINFETFEAEVAKLESNNTDWLGNLVEPTISHNHTFNVSGGGKSLAYYASVYYNENLGEVRNNNQKKFGYNASIRHWLVENKVSLSASFRGAETITSGLSGESPYTYAINTSRTLPDYNEDGSRYFYRDGNYLYNIEHETENRWNNNTQNNNNMAISLNWNIVEGLKFDASYSLAHNSTVGEAVSTEYSNYITSKRGYEFGTVSPESVEYKESKLPRGGELRTTENSSKSWGARAALSFNEVIDKHSFGFTAGFEARSNSYSGLDAMFYGYMPDRGHTFVELPDEYLSYDGETYNINDLVQNQTRSITDRLENSIGYYLNVNYSYDQRYVFSASIRNDVSNRFGQTSKEKFLPVYSLGLRWNVNEESWMDNIRHIINNLAIRGSYGYQGNVATNFGPELIGEYSSSGISTLGFGVLGLSIVSLPYEDLRWEKTRSYNFGADFGLFENKIQVGYNYYNKRTTDVITMVEVAQEWGIASMPINDGVINNAGWDVSMGLTPIRRNGWVWSISYNYSKNINNVESETEPENSWQNATSGNLIKDGYPISSVWAYQYDGLCPETGRPLISYKNEDTGNYDYNDVTTWLHHVGQLDPTFSGGFSTSLRYKNLSFSSSFSMQFGASRWLSNYVPTTSISPYDNLRTDLNDRWREPGDELIPGVMPSLPQVDGYEAQEKAIPVIDNLGEYETENVYALYNRSDVRFVKANYFKCTSMSLGYTLQENALKKLNLNSLGFRFSLSNPFRISSKAFKDVDPEVMFGGMPKSRTASLTINIGF